MSHPDRTIDRQGALLSALQPLRRRVPLTMTIVLAAIVAAMLWLGYDRVYDSVIAAETARLRASARQLVTTLTGNVQRIRADDGRLARMPEVARAISSFASAGDRAAAARALAAIRARNAQTRSLSLWSADGRLLLSDGAAGDRPPRLLESRVQGTDSTDIGPFVQSGDTVLYETSTPVIQSGRTQGFVSVTRRVASSAETAALLKGLVGKGAGLLLGNPSGDVWTDFVGPRRGPARLRGATDGLYTDQSGVERLFAALPIAESPWMVVVDVPREEAVTAAREFVWRMLALGLLLLVAGVAIGWWLIRSALRPIDEVPAVVEESDQRYRDLIDSSPHGIIVHLDREIVFANSRATEILGFERAEDLVGRSVLDFVPPDDRRMVDARVEAVQRGERSAPYEIKVVRPDRKHTIIEVTSLPFVVDGGTAVQTIMDDVTEQRTLQDQLRQSQKMDAVGRLAGGIAHDFNNLLTVIQAHAEFALSEPTSTQARADIEEIRRATESAARLTRQLLTFSRNQALQPETVDLNAAVQGVLGMITRLIGDDIEVVDVAAPDLLPICADRGHLEQVLMNLSVNARDAMPDGGVLRIETANVEIGEGYHGASGAPIPPGSYVMLSVTDTGVGMTEEVQAHVFEPFFTTKQPGRGTGLGLSTVYGIVNQSDGHIWVYSEPGRGTTFKIFFPPDRPQAARVMTPTPPSAIPRLHATVLVVEDQANVRLAIVRVLHRANLTVIEARDTAGALASIDEHPEIDLVVTDMMMPGGSGVELIEELAVRLPGTPVVLMSGYAEGAALGRWRVPGNATFIEKPVSPQSLLELVERLLSPSARQAVVD